MREPFEFSYIIVSIPPCFNHLHVNSSSSNWQIQYNIIHFSKIYYSHWQSLQIDSLHCTTVFHYTHNMTYCVDRLLREMGNMKGTRVRRRNKGKSQVLLAQTRRSLPPLLLEREEERIVVKTRTIHPKDQEAEIKPHHRIRNLE